LVYAGSGGNFNIDNFLVVTDSFAATAPNHHGVALSQTVYAGAGRVLWPARPRASQPLRYFWQKDGSLLVMAEIILGRNHNISPFECNTAAAPAQYSLIVRTRLATDTAPLSDHDITVNDLPANLLYSEAFPFVGPVAGNYHRQPRRLGQCHS